MPPKLNLTDEERKEYLRKKNADYQAKHRERLGKEKYNEEQREIMKKVRNGDDKEHYKELNRKHNIDYYAKKRATKKIGNVVKAKSARTDFQEKKEAVVNLSSVLKRAVVQQKLIPKTYKPTARFPTLEDWREYNNFRTALNRFRKKVENEEKGLPAKKVGRPSTKK